MKKFINMLFCHILYKVKYKNIENLKGLDKCLICPNHSSIFDPTFIYPVVDNLYIMAKKEIFKNKLIAKLLKHYNTFPVDRKKVDAKSLLSAMKIFDKNDECRLLIFPEGKVVKNEDEVGNVVRNGAVFISKYKNVPIVPVKITRRPKFFSNVIVTFGNPIYIDDYGEDNKKEKLKVKSLELIKCIYKL